jgi:hypothetical protein
MKKNKIEYGSVHIPAEDFLPQNTKIRISMWIAGDVLDAYKAAAEKRGMGYQTLMQEILRDCMGFLDEKQKFSVQRFMQRMAEMEGELADVKATVAKLAGKSLKKKRA